MSQTGQTDLQILQDFWCVSDHFEILCIQWLGEKCNCFFSFCSSLALRK